MLDQFVSAAHTNVSLCPYSIPFYLFLIIVQNVKALLTVGGWTGSVHWSSSVATSQNRSTFANNVAQFAHAHNLDGIDFEYVWSLFYF